MADYDESIVDCAQVGGHSSIWTLCALATVLSRHIVSVYPPVNGENDAAPGILNVEVAARPTSSFVTALEPIRILWTRLQRINPRLQWTPNHFVPLVPLSCKEGINPSHEITPLATENNNEVPTLLEPHKRGIRMFHLGYAYVRDRAYKDKQ